MPSKTNAFILEISLLDYFAYTDRAVAFEVRRDQEFAAVREGTGPQSPMHARAALSALHRSWIVSAGGGRNDDADSSVLAEVSPLLSYEGEGLGQKGVGVEFPCHLTGADEVPISTVEDKETSAADPSNLEVDATMDGLDTRLFYMQEYPQRLQMSHSHAPQFRTNSRNAEGPVPQKRMQPGARTMNPGQSQGNNGSMQIPMLWQPSGGQVNAQSLLTSWRVR